MTTLFQISLGYDELNSRYCAAAYGVTENEVTTAVGTINKVWREIGNRVKEKEKLRKNFPLPKIDPSVIIDPSANGIELPPERKIIISDY